MLELQKNYEKITWKFALKLLLCTITPYLFCRICTIFFTIYTIFLQTNKFRGTCDTFFVNRLSIVDGNETLESVTIRGIRKHTRPRQCGIVANCRRASPTLRPTTLLFRNSTRRLSIFHACYFRVRQDILFFRLSEFLKCPSPSFRPIYLEKAEFHLTPGGGGAVCERLHGKTQPSERGTLPAVYIRGFYSVALPPSPTLTIKSNVTEE